jgi:hypothetical protein
MDMKVSEQGMKFILSWEQEFLPVLESVGDELHAVLCTSCFHDEGLRLEAARFGIEAAFPCPHCSAPDGLKLTVPRLQHVIYRYFTSGSIVRHDYGGYPAYVSNGHRPSDIATPRWLTDDLALLSEKTGWGVIGYGPRAWMWGEITPLKLMLESDTQQQIFERISNEYPTQEFTGTHSFYRMRRNVEQPELENNYDSPPRGSQGTGRLDSVDFPVLYGSQDLQLCVHECRSTMDDEIYVATLAPRSTLRLLDLAVLLPEEFSLGEFESLDLAVHMLFLARGHSYPVSRALAKFLHSKGFDGVLYPSYFSLLRTGARLFETVYGMSIRRVEREKGAVAAHILPNIGIFGRPLSDGRVSVKSIDRVRLERAQYKLNFGPVISTEK